MTRAMPGAVPRPQHGAMQPAALSTRSNFADPDAAYRMLVEAHRGLADEASALLDAALVLILANHIGDAAVLQEALALARRQVLGPEPRQDRGGAGTPLRADAAVAQGG